MSTSIRSGALSVHEDGEPYRVEDVYRAHRHWLIRFLRRRFGREEAEDLAQETYLRLVRAGVEASNARALLARVALNAARDRARRRAVRPALVSAEAAPPPACAAAQADALLLKQVVLALPPKLQEVFVMSRFGGLTYEEIGRRCGISVKTVEGRMTKALAICSAMMD